MKTLRFTAILEGDKDGYYAYCPELKGCQTQGESVDEALANLREAAELYLETLSTEELDGLATNPKTILSTSVDVVHA
jgi:predicted RNase H-like HicB family nuclease